MVAGEFIKPAAINQQPKPSKLQAMKIKIILPVMLAGKMYVTGKVIQIAAPIANELIARGIAIAVTDAPAPASAPAQPPANK